MTSIDQQEPTDGPLANPTTGAAGAQVTKADEEAASRYFFNREEGTVLVDHFAAHRHAAVEAACAEWKKAHEVMKQVAFAEQKERRELRAQLATKSAEVEKLRDAMHTMMVLSHLIDFTQFPEQAVEQVNQINALTCFFFKSASIPNTNPTI